MHVVVSAERLGPPAGNRSDGADRIFTVLKPNSGVVSTVPVRKARLRQLTCNDEQRLCVLEVFPFARQCSGRGNPGVPLFGGQLFEHRRRHEIAQPRVGFTEIPGADQPGGLHPGARVFLRHLRRRRGFDSLRGWRCLLRSWRRRCAADQGARQHCGPRDRRSMHDSPRPVARYARRYTRRYTRRYARRYSRRSRPSRYDFFPHPSRMRPVDVRS